MKNTLNSQLKDDNSVPNGPPEGNQSFLFTLAKLMLRPVNLDGVFT